MTYLPSCNIEHKIIFNLAIGPSIIARILTGKRYVRENGLYYTSCDKSTYEPIYFKVGGYWLEMNPETYVMKDT